MIDPRRDLTSLAQVVDVISDIVADKVETRLAARLAALPAQAAAAAPVTFAEDDAAEQLGLNVRALQDAARTGAIASLKLPGSRQRRYTRAALDKYVADCLATVRPSRSQMKVVRNAAGGR